MFKIIQIISLVISGLLLSAYVGIDSKDLVQDPSASKAPTPLQAEFENDKKDGFSDISQQDNFYAAIKFSKEQGIVNGFSDGEFKQWELVSRYEFAKVIVKATFTEGEINSCDESIYLFPDIFGEAKQKFGKYVCMAKKYNLIKGFSSGFYEGGLPIKSEEAMKVIAIAFNLAKAEDEDTANPDKLKPFVTKLSELKSVPPTIEYPDKKLQRGEMVEIIFRIKNNITDKEFKGIDEIYGSNLKDGEIVLENKIIDNNTMILSWTVSETLNTEHGFKIVKGIIENPVYPGSAIYISDGTVRQYEFGIPSGGIYFVRVCRYLTISNSCDSYSNNIKIVGELNPINTTGDIKLYSSVNTTNGKVLLEWQTANASDENGGFKIAYSSTNQNPKYPKDQWIYIDNSTIRRRELELEVGKLWYIRICKYNTGNSSCDYYSNTVKADLTSKDINTLNNDITLIQIYGIGSTVKWKANATPKSGVKVIWSKSENPTYPPRGSDKAEFRTDGSMGQTNVTAFNGEGKYYIRVCDYIAEKGACGIYSNQITLDLY
ncbi:S-layer homology domain-containing protein [Candidatus Dojkabacteria bacterium]|nr:S-layer homology domain-containing protein [Candidatus Dojkabacteria bacterium]